MAIRMQPLPYRLKRYINVRHETKLEVCPELENVHQVSPGSLVSPDTYDEIYRYGGLYLLGK